MLIHLFDLLTDEGKSISTSCEFGMKEITFQNGSFEVAECSPVQIHIKNTGKKVLEIFAEAEMKVIIPCDRCLEPVETVIPLSFSRKVDMNLSEEERVNELDESSYIAGTDLDVDLMIYLEVLMSWPLKVLCNENCKGICSQCGKNLNEGSCNCEDQPKDLRMAAISDIFSKFKEV